MTRYQRSVLFGLVLTVPVLAQSPAPDLRGVYIYTNDVSQVSKATNTVEVLIHNASVTPLFAGLASQGLDQINLTLPAGLGTGDVSLVVTVGGAQSPAGAVISLQ